MPPYPAVVCVGLDGATFDVIDPLIAEGRLPVLARLIAGGTRAPLRSVVPPLSAPAWVSFMTGTNPGHHGVYHFRALERDGVGATLVGSWQYKGTTIFDRASAAGKRVLAFRVPMTYPAWPINGTMISGFPTPDPRTTYSEPVSAGEAIGPLVQMNAMRSIVSSVDDQAANFDFYLDRSTEVIAGMLRDDPVDLFCYVNSVTDWIAHKFWRFSDPLSPAHEAHPVDGGKTLLESFYEKVDASLGAILDAAPENALVVVMSDHGTGRRSVKRFDTGAWLASLELLVRPPRARRTRRAAVLQWAKDVMPKKHWLWNHAPGFLKKAATKVSAERSAVDWGRSQAFPVKLDHHVEGVAVNRDVVGDDRYEAVRDAVIAAAADVAQIISARRREDVFRGPHTHVAPDVILELDPTYEFGPAGGGVLGEVPDRRVRRSSATHRPDGILVMSGPGVRAGVDLGAASLLDVPPTLLWGLGMDVPEIMDGEVLTTALTDDFAAAHPVTRSAEGDLDGAAAAVYTADEEEQLAAHLEELGYL